MKLAFEVEETIDASPETVWSIMTDWTKADRWMGAVKVLEPAAAAGARAGDRIAFTSRGKRTESCIAAWEPGRLLSLETVQSGVTARYDYHVEASPDGTRLRLEARCTSRGVPWSLLAPLVRWAMKRTDSGQLRALRELVLEVA